MTERRTSASTSWAQFPDLPTRATTVTTERRLVAFVALAVAPAVAAASAGRLPTVLVTVATAGVAWALARGGPRWYDPCAAVAVGAALLVADGEVRPGVVLAGAGLAAAVGIVGAIPADRPRPAPDTVLALGVLGAVATMAGPGHRWAATAAVIATVVVAAGAVVAPKGLASVQSRFRRGAKPIATVLVSAGLTLVAFVFVVIPWIVQTVFRWNPTWVPHPRGSRWVEVHGAGTANRRMGEPDRRRQVTTIGRRLHRAAMTTGCLVVTIAVVGTYLWAVNLQRDHARFDVPALAGEPWWPNMSDAMTIAYGQAQITSYAGVEMADSSYPGFNVVHGRRLTWQPPGACTDATVWMFGGSTLFGLGQRDTHTIASELARLAWSQHIRLHIENWGVPADTAWMEARRLELAIESGLAPPDLVVFYDGDNDFRVQLRLNDDDRGGRLLFANDLDADALKALQHRTALLSRFVDLTRSGPDMHLPKGTHLSPERVGAYAARGYAAVDDLLGPIVKDKGLDVMRFYQPSRVTRSPQLPSEAEPGEVASDYGRIERAFRRKLAPGVIDLSGAMDRSKEPVYYDQLHTNELGARLVAQAMWPKLRARLHLEATRCP